VELVVTPDARDALRVLTDERVEAAREEPGVLRDERCISADGTVIHVDERSTDSVAAVPHLRLFARQFGRRFMDLVDRTWFTVYGTPSTE
jgi:hypothetical protein